MTLFEMIQNLRSHRGRGFGLLSSVYINRVDQEMKGNRAITMRYSYYENSECCERVALVWFDCLASLRANRAYPGK